MNIKLLCGDILIALEPFDYIGLASWCVAVGPENVKGLRKLRPRVELHPSGKARALATEQKRYVHPDLAMRHAQCRVC